MKKIFASEVLTLDSDVCLGGGTDVTDEFQKLLDLAKDGGIHIIMDGAALIHGLKVYSNTIIECLGSDAGFFMADHTDRPMFTNAAWSLKESERDRNISFIGGTYNHNCTKQAHDVPIKEYPLPEAELRAEFRTNHLIYLMEFYGVENFKISGVTFRNQRTFTLTIGNFENVIVEDSCIKMADHVQPSNQDGFHFFGPGRFLTIRNMRGRTGDDIINIGPDEMDGVSSITDVLLDGIYFDETCQGIRMLSRGSGLLDRVTVKNVTGSFRTFAFSINPFFQDKTFGKYGDIYFENIDLRQIEATYDYTPLTYFQVGGDCHCITLKNVRFHTPIRNTTVFDVGRPFFYRPTDETFVIDIDYGDTICDKEWIPEVERPKINNFIIDGLTVTSDEKFDGTDIFELRYEIENFVAKNIQVFRSDEASTSGNLIKLKKEANIKNMIIEDVFAEKLDSILVGNKTHKINLLKLNNVTLKDGGNVLEADSVDIKAKLENNITKI